MSPAAFTDAWPPWLREVLYALEERAESGEQLHRLSGFVWTGGEGLSRATYYRRRAELRALGIDFQPARVSEL